MKSWHWLVLIIFILILLGLRGIYPDVQEVFTLPDSPALAYWAETNSYPIVTSVEGDINGDGRLDMVLIYQIAPDKARSA